MELPQFQDEQLTGYMELMWQIRVGYVLDKRSGKSYVGRISTVVFSKYWTECDDVATIKVLRYMRNNVVNGKPTQNIC